MFYEVVHGVLKPLTHAIYRPTVTGLDNVPRTGAVILASNHLSFIDSFVIPLAAPRQVHFLAKAEYWAGTTRADRMRAAWFEAVGAVPVDRDSARAAQDSLDTGLQILREGKAFALYPEGTRSRDGRLYRGRTGVAWLALTAGCPVVPVGLLGTQDIQPIGSRLPRLAKVTVRFGKPIQVAGRYDSMPQGRARRELTDEVMEGIHHLTGQVLAGSYNERPAGS